jgi:hypothetical protein
MDTRDFATCPNCGEQFAIATIAEHPDVVPIGMLLEYVDDHYHFYFFNHVAAHCGTTFVVPVSDFLPYITEPVPELALTGSEACEHRCTELKDLQACRQQCRYAPFRRHLLQMRMRRAKAGELAGSR